MTGNPSPGRSGAIPPGRSRIGCCDCSPPTRPMGPRRAWIAVAPHTAWIAGTAPRPLPREIDRRRHHGEMDALRGQQTGVRANDLAVEPAGRVAAAVAGSRRWSCAERERVLGWPAGSPWAADVPVSARAGVREPLPACPGRGLAMPSRPLPAEVCAFRDRHRVSWRSTTRIGVRFDRVAAKATRPCGRRSAQRAREGAAAMLKDLGIDQ